MEDNSDLSSRGRFLMIETLFTQALGLVAPWQVDHVNFVQEAGRIDFRVKFGAAIHACPACGEGAQPLHGRLARTWRHLDFFEYEAHLHAEVPRVAWVSERFAVQGLLPSNPLTKALAYARDRRFGLEVFLTDPDVPIDTNHLERTLRAIPMGRRNWLSCWTELGLGTSASSRA